MVCMIMIVIRINNLFHGDNDYDSNVLNLTSTNE